MPDMGKVAFDQTIKNIDTVEQLKISGADITSLVVFGGQGLAGATRNSGTGTITIPQGQTGFQSWNQTAVINLPYKLSLVGQKLTFSILIIGSPNLASNKSLISNIHVVRNGAQVIDKADSPARITYITPTLTKIEIDYTITSSDGELRPYYQIYTTTNTDGGTLQFAGLKYTLASGTKSDASINSFVMAKAEIATKTVKPDGTGDYLSPKLANDGITDSSANKVYQVTVYPGTYTETGWTLKPYIHLIGTDKATCILNGSLPDNSDDNTINNTSTIWVNSTNDLQNLTITAKNMRYAVHDESSNTVQNWTRNLKNCHFEHYGNEAAKTWRTNNPGSGLLASNVWVSVCAYGMGHSSGAVLNAEDCTFKALFAPFSVHNNTNYTKPCLVHLKRCNIYKVNSTYDYALRVQSLGSFMNDRVILEGCHINAPIIHNDAGWAGGVQSSHINFAILGYGNSYVPYEWGFATSEVYRPSFTDEYKRYTANASITKGQAVAFVTDYRTIKAMTNTDDISLFAGIAIENMVAGDMGLVKTKGFIAKTDLYNFTGSITFGTKYGVNTDGSLTVSTSAIIIGFDANNVKII